VTPFEPLGDKARWRIIYDLLARCSVGATVKYDDIATALGLDPDVDRHTIQLAMRRASREYEARDRRALEAVPNVGYRVVEAEEHLRLARGQQKRSTRALARGHSKVVNVDLTGVQPDVRRAFEAVAMAFTMQLDFNRRTDVRQARLEKSLDQISERHDHSEEEIAELKKRLARLETSDATGDMTGQG
jgi:hypothetical protein